MRWNYKHLVGLSLIVLGLVGIFMARHYVSQIEEAKSTVGFFTSPFADTPAGGVVKKGLMDQASQYDVQVLVLLYGGIALTIAGIVTLFYFWKKG